MVEGLKVVFMYVAVVSKWMKVRPRQGGLRPKYNKKIKVVVTSVFFKVLPGDI